MQDAVQAAAAAQERRIRAENYRATLIANIELADARAAKDAADRQAELLRSEAELQATLADPYLGEDPAMAASSLSAYRSVLLAALIAVSWQEQSRRICTLRHRERRNLSTVQH